VATDIIDYDLKILLLFKSSTANGKKNNTHPKQY